MKLGWYVYAIGAILLCVVLFGWVNGLWNTGIAHEKQLTAQYLDNQNYLSAYISGFYEQVSVAEVQSDVLNAVLLDAVKGRYDDGGLTVNSPVFAAIVEAYPEAGLSQLMENWGKIQDYISAGREGYRAVQSKLLDELRAYDTWRETGLIKRGIVRILGFPSSGLEARIGETVMTGDLARQQMYQIVLTEQARDAYKSGTMQPLKIGE